MKDKFSLDTNILVYLFDKKAADKQKKAHELVAHALETNRGVISVQVAQEFLNVVTGKFKIPLSFEDSQAFSTTVLRPLCDAFSDIDLLIRALRIKERYRMSFYDSLIIAAALQSNCSILYSEDLQDGQEIEFLKIVNPFVTEINFSHIT